MPRRLRSRCATGAGSAPTIKGPASTDCWVSTCRDLREDRRVIRRLAQGVPASVVTYLRAGGLRDSDIGDRPPHPH